MLFRSLVRDEAFENFDAFTAIEVVVICEEPRELDDRAVAATFVHSVMLGRAVWTCCSATHRVELSIWRNASEVRETIRKSEERGDRTDVPNFVIGESLRPHLVNLCVGDRR